MLGASRSVLACASSNAAVTPVSPPTDGRFIDEIDRFERLFLVILTSPNFYKDKTLDPTVQRCYFDYDALQTRIGQEVHDARNANPAASLVQLGGEK